MIDILQAKLKQVLNELKTCKKGLHRNDLERQVINLRRKIRYEQKRAVN